MIRPAQRDDIASIVDIAVFAEMFAAEEAGFLVALLSSHFDEIESRDESCGEWLVTERDSAVVAVTYHVPVEATDGAWYIKMIGVSPQFQRAGIGKEMMAEVERRLRLGNGRLILVETSATPEYDAARAFYSSIGYQDEARVRDFYTDGDDMVLFRKRL